jgi:hypothetical protein
MWKSLLVLPVLLLFAIVAFGQSGKEGNTSRDPSSSGKVEKRSEYPRIDFGKAESKGKKKKRRDESLSGEFDRKVDEYHERMEENARQRKKMAKEMEKPQYSDPTYFGHKKKPKKRPPGKKKFCKECGLTH